MWWPQPPLRCWLGLVSQLQARLYLLSGLVHFGQHGGGRGCGGCQWAKLCRILCLSSYARMCERTVCVNGSCEEESASEFSRVRKKRELFQDEILGSLEAQGTAGAILPPSALVPSSFPSLSNLLHFLPRFLVSPSLFILSCRNFFFFNPQVLLTWMLLFQNEIKLHHNTPGPL